MEETSLAQQEDRTTGLISIETVLPASPFNYKPPSILQNNFRKVDPSFLSLCNHECSVFLKTFINALLSSPHSSNWSVKILTVFIQEFILYVFLEKLLYWSTDLLTLRRDMIVVLRVVPLRYTCQKFYLIMKSFRCENKQTNRKNTPHKQAKHNSPKFQPLTVTCSLALFSSTWNTVIMNFLLEQFCPTFCEPHFIRTHFDYFKRISEGIFAWV